MQPTHARLADALAIALAVAAGLAAFACIRDYGLLGLDTYPLLAASRLDGPADVWHALASPMHGEGIQEVYYRPLPTLLLGLDHALWGLAPAGYHATTALLFGGGGVALYVAARWLGLGLGALVALGLFVFHPAHVSWLPVPSRRPEILCLGFLLLALGAQARSAGRGERASVRSALLGALAILSKESGFLVLALAPLVVALSTTGTLRTRLRSAARASVPHGVVAAALLAVRVVVLGGVVGARPLALGAMPAGVMATCESLIRGLAAAPGLFGLAGSVAIAVAALGLAWRRGSEAAVVRVGVLAAVWILLLALLYAATGGVQPWYLVLPLGAAALALGGVADACLGPRARGSRSRLAISALGLAGLALLGLGWARTSPLLHHYGDWERASQLADRYLTRVADELARTPDAAVAFLPAPPLWAPPRADERRAPGVIVLAPSSVRGWIAVALPERRVRVEVEGTGDVPTPAPDEVVLVLRPRTPRSDARAAPAGKRPD